jgi:signal transduction histidine kinase
MPFGQLKGKKSLTDVRVKNAKDKDILANVTVQAMSVKGRSILVLMIQEVRVAYQELIEQNQKLRELDLAKDRFISLTTHELRTPISAMVSSVEILRDGHYDGPQQQKEFLDIIHEQGVHLQELVDDILDFAKIRANRMDFYIEKRSAMPFIAELRESFQSMANNRKIDLHIEVPTSPMDCYFDDIRLRQVLGNLVNNAIKYNHDGGQVRVYTRQTPRVVQVFIEDTGPGIPKKHYRNIFNEFETIGQVARHHKGTGLGLPISQRLIKGMGGTIHLSSKVGEGSCFWIEIPKTKVLAAELYRPRPDLTADLAAA